MTQVSVIAIGASLGGLRALQIVLRALPRELPASVTVAQHRRADPESRLLSLLARECALPVIEPEDKAPLEKGHVYLAPSDYHLLVARGSLALSVDPPVQYARPSIDVLFESVSALGTVGSSTGITATLPDAARLWLVPAMFIGRLGPLTLVLALSARARPVAYRNAVETIRIG